MAAQQLTAQQLSLHPDVSDICDANGKKLSLEVLLKREDAETRWIPATSSEWGWLS